VDDDYDHDYGEDDDDSDDNNKLQIKESLYKERDVCGETISILRNIFLRFNILQYCSISVYKSGSPTVTEYRESV
jgi:hypothetical protein